MAFPVLPVVGGIVVAGGGLLFAFKDKVFGKKAAPAAATAAPAAAPAAAAPSPPPGVPAPPAAPAQPAAAPAAPSPKSSDPTKATVTTNDPPPMGDLNLMNGPSNSSGQKGGIDKGMTVDVLTWNAGTADGVTWSYVRAPAGKNRAGGTGYVKQKYLKP